MNTNKLHRFLVIRTDRIGDVILSTPVPSAIKCSYPGAYISMMVNPYTKQIVSGHPDIDNIILDDREKEHKGLAGLIKLARHLRFYHFDVAILLHPTFRLALLCWLAKIPVRVGTAYRAYSWLFNQKLRQHRKKSARHELDLNLDLASVIGARLNQVQFSINIPQKADENVNKILTQKGIASNQPFIVIHAGSGGSALDWPLEKFGRLANRIQTNLAVPVICTGGNKEAAIVDQVVSASKINLIRLDGLLSIKELAALLKRSSLTIANSTGPLHLAVAVGSKVIGLYCPILPCSPNRWGTLQSDGFRHPSPCRNMRNMY